MGAEVASGTVRILKYDIGFCLYFFFTIAALGYNCYALTQLICSGTAPALCAVGLIFTHASLSVCYLFCFFCGHKVSATSSKRKGKHAVPDAQSVPAVAVFP